MSSSISWKVLSAPHRLYRAYLMPVTRGSLEPAAVQLTLTTPGCTSGRLLNIGAGLGHPAEKSYTYIRAHRWSNVSHIAEDKKEYGTHWKTVETSVRWVWTHNFCLESNCASCYPKDATSASCGSWITSSLVQVGNGSNNQMLLAQGQTLNHYVSLCKFTHLINQPTLWRVLSPVQLVALVTARDSIIKIEMHVTTIYGFEINSKLLICLCLMTVQNFRTPLHMCTSQNQCWENSIQWSNSIISVCTPQVAAQESRTELGARCNSQMQVVPRYKFKS